MVVIVVVKRDGSRQIIGPWPIAKAREAHEYGKKHLDRQWWVVEEMQTPFVSIAGRVR